MTIAEQIGSYKKNNNVTIFQQSRWNEVLEKAMAKASRVGLSEEFITRYMDAIHMESINRQNQIMNND
jgi:chorismate mutase